MPKRAAAPVEYDHDPGDDPHVTVLQMKLSKAQWRALRAAFPDAAPASTYDRWLAQERAFAAKVLAKGYRVVRKPVPLAAAVAWCRRRKLPMTAKSLFHFACSRLRPAGTSAGRGKPTKAKPGSR
jgi:hypothetical protein